MQQQDSVFQIPGQNSLELEGEIRILERRKRQLVEDLEHSDRARAKQMELLNAEIKALTQVKNDLSIEIFNLTKKDASLKVLVAESMETYRKYTSGENRQIAADREKAITEANTILESAKKRETDSISHQNAIEEEQKRIYQVSKDLDLRENDLNHRDEVVKFTETDTKGRLLIAEEKITSLTTQKAELEAEIARQTVRSRELDLELNQKKDRAYKMLLDVQGREAAVTNREKAHNNSAATLAEERKQLDIYKRQLDDRSETLSRAYNEIIAKGGKVDGE